MNKGSNSQEAIAILNYIARFNGSKNRIPNDANFDILGQYMEEQSAKFTNTFSNHANQSSYISRVHCNKSKMTVLDNNTFKEIIKTLKELYFNPKHNLTHIVMCVMNVCFTNIYFLALYNSKNLKGDEFTIGILFGLSECFGVLIGEKVISRVPETIGFRYSLLIAMVCFLSIKVLDLTQAMTYAFLLV